MSARELIALVWAVCLALLRVAWRAVRPSHEWRARNGQLPSKRVAVVGGGIAGCACAWALRESGVAEVVVFEAREELGGNAKTATWHLEKADGSAERVACTTGLSVLAWPESYFRNYNALLRRLTVATTHMDIRFFIHHPDQGDNEFFAHDLPSSLQDRFGPDLGRWCALVRFVRRVNAVFSGDSTSLYSMSFLNPLNLVPLRLACRAWGVSPAFWEGVLVPLYSSSFLTVHIGFVPATIVPVLDDMISPLHASTMQTWTDTSAAVFSRLTEGVTVRAGVQVAAVTRGARGLLCVTDNRGRADHFDHVVFACNADAARAALAAGGTGSTLTDFLLARVQYCDDDDTSLVQGVVHSDASILPAEHRARLLAGYTNYIAAYRTDDSPRVQLENTFILSSWVPAAARCRKAHGTHPLPMLVTYNLRPTRKLEVGKVRGKVDNRRAHPHLSPTNLAVSQLLRLVQGEGGVYFCGSYTTPGNGHDLSLLSGLVVAHALGAAYPFGADARDDFRRLRALMGL